MPEGANRLKEAEDSLRAAKLLLEEGLYRDSVSRAYATGWEHGDQTRNPARSNSPTTSFVVQHFTAFCCLR